VNAELASRVPKLEAPQEPRESPESPGPRAPTDPPWRPSESPREAEGHG
jgi:hypothetical protein